MTRGLWRSGRKARAAERRCAGPVAARVRIAAPPVLPDGGRPVGTAWKGFESDVALLLFPPALRRCEASLRSLRKLPKHVENDGVSNLPSRSGRAGQHSIECVPARCVLQRRPGRRRGYGGAGAARCAGAAWMLVAAPPCCAGGRPVGTAWKDSKLRRFCICRPLRGGDAASLCWPQFLFVFRMPALSGCVCPYEPAPVRAGHVCPCPPHLSAPGRSSAAGHPPVPPACPRPARPAVSSCVQLIQL